MNHEYCFHCGTKIYFRVCAPANCPSCGKSHKDIPKVDASNNQEGQALPRIDRRKAAISVQGEDQRSISLKDLILSTSPEEAEYKPEPRPAPKVLKDDEDILNAMLKQCGPTRESKDLLNE